MGVPFTEGIVNKGYDDVPVFDRGERQERIKEAVAFSQTIDDILSSAELESAGEKKYALADYLHQELQSRDEEQKERLLLRAFRLAAERERNKKLDQLDNASGWDYDGQEELMDTVFLELGQLDRGALSKAFVREVFSMCAESLTDKFYVRSGDAAYRYADVPDVARIDDYTQSADTQQQSAEQYLAQGLLALLGPHLSEEDRQVHLYGMIDAFGSHLPADTVYRTLADHMPPDALVEELQFIKEPAYASRDLPLVQHYERVIREVYVHETALDPDGQHLSYLDRELSLIGLDPEQGPYSAAMPVKDASVCIFNKSNELVSVLSQSSLERALENGQSLEVNGVPLEQGFIQSFDAYMRGFYAQTGVFPEHLTLRQHESLFRYLGTCSESSYQQVVRTARYLGEGFLKTCSLAADYPQIETQIFAITQDPSFVAEDLRTLFRIVSQSLDSLGRVEESLAAHLHGESREQPSAEKVERAMIRRSLGVLEKAQRAAASGSLDLFLERSADVAYDAHEFSALFKSYVDEYGFDGAVEAFRDIDLHVDEYPEDALFGEAEQLTKRVYGSQPERMGAALASLQTLMEGDGPKYFFRRDLGLGPELVGMIGFAKEEVRDDGRTVFYAGGLKTDPNHGGANIGNFLIEKTIREMAEQGHLIHGYTAPEIPLLERHLERTGFVITGVGEGEPYDGLCDIICDDERNARLQSKQLSLAELAQLAGLPGTNGRFIAIPVASRAEFASDAVRAQMTQLCQRGYVGTRMQALEGGGMHLFFEKQQPH